MANLTQFGRAMKQQGIQMIPAYSPRARGLSERVFGAHQDRLAIELAFQGITDITAANCYSNRVYRATCNAEFMQPAPEEGTTFVPWAGDTRDDVLCYQEEQTVRADNCVSFEAKLLQILQDQHRCH